MTLHGVAKDVDRTKSEKKSSWEAGMTLGQVEAELKDYLAGVKSTTAAQRVKEHIKTQAPKFYDAIFGVEEDGWTTVTRKDELCLLIDWVSAGSPSESTPRGIEELQEEEPETLSHMERTSLYESWSLEVLESQEEDFISLHDDYQDAKKRYGAVVREVSQ